MEKTAGEIITLTVVTLFYLFIVAYLGFRGYRDTKSAADYLVAGRKAHPIIVYGAYDLILEALVDSNKGLVRFLTEELSKVEGLAKTETFLLLRSYNKWI